VPDYEMIHEAKQTLIIVSLSLERDSSSFYFPHATSLRTDGKSIMINNTVAHQSTYRTPPK